MKDKSERSLPRRPFRERFAEQWTKDKALAGKQFKEFIGLLGYLYAAGAGLCGIAAGLFTWYQACVSAGWVVGFVLGWIPGLVVAFLVGLLWPLAVLAIWWAVQHGA